MLDQFSLFGDKPDSNLPEGFRYQPAVIPFTSETTLLDEIRALPFREFEFHGYTGKRRVVSFGWQYDFSARQLKKVDDMPAFLLDLREIAAEFADMKAAELQQVLVTEYAAGAGIGWHKDKAVFGQVVGISLLSPCTFRLRRKKGEGWERVSIVAEPRSAYLLSGPSRTEWEHSSPEVDALRYSVTFRNLLDS